MGVLFDKDGKRYDIPHPVDMKEALKTGKYYAVDPTKKKVLIKPARKKAEKKTVDKVEVKEEINDEVKEEINDVVFDVPEKKDNDTVKPLFGKKNSI